MSSVAERIAEINLEAEVARPKVKKSKKPRQKVTTTTEANTTLYAKAGIVLTLVMSGLLNAYANSTHATVPWAGALLGIAIPVIVLLLARTAGQKFKTDKRPAAYLAAGSGLSLLFLSVLHCAESISMLTGSGMFLSLPLAIAIDLGLVSFEVSLLTEDSK